MGRQRQQLCEIDVAMNVLLHRRRLHFPPPQRMERGVLEFLQQLVFADAHGLGDPAAIGDQPGNDADRMAVGLWKKRRFHAIEAFANGCELESQRHTFAHDRQAVVPLQMVEPAAQAEPARLYPDGAWVGGSLSMLGRPRLFMGNPWAILGGLWPSSALPP